MKWFCFALCRRYQLLFNKVLLKPFPYFKNIKLMLNEM